MSRQPPPVISPADSVVLFDGVCKFCAGAVQFIIPRDPRASLKLAAMQSDTGQALLRWAGLPLDDFDTMVFIERGRVYTRSTAILRITRFLRWPWPLFSLAVSIPGPIRDYLYREFAKNRYLLFGKNESCMMPTPDVARRFL